MHVVELGSAQKRVCGWCCDAAAVNTELLVAFGSGVSFCGCWKADVAVCGENLFRYLGQIKKNRAWVSEKLPVVGCAAAARRKESCGVPRAWEKTCNPTNASPSVYLEALVRSM